MRADANVINQWILPVYDCHSNVLKPSYKEKKKSEKDGEIRGNL
jgi:hypothetical protein